MHRIGLPAFVFPLLACAVGHAPSPSGGSRSSIGYAVERACADAEAEHQPVRSGDAVLLGTRASGRARIDGAGATLPLASGDVSLGLTHLGRDATMRVAVSATAEVDGAEVHITRAPGVTEWWRSLASGLEHGVTIDERPAGSGELVLEVGVAGATPVLDGEAIALRRGGSTIATYSHLVVVDALGAELPARMAAVEAGILIRVDDSGARYPLVVDPLVVTEEAVLSPGAVADDLCGDSVAITADGTRAVVGCGHRPMFVGSGRRDTARVYLRTGTTWTLEGGVLTGGTSVAISADGSRVVTGSPNENADGGAAYIYVRSGTTWTQEARVNSPRTLAQFGETVAISGDGTRFAMGAPYYLGATARGDGSFIVYLRSGSTWTLEYQAIGASFNRLGESLSFDATGTRLAAGRPQHDTGSPAVGRVGVYLRAGTSWSLETTLAGSGGENTDWFGQSVALTPDGTRLVVGAPRDNTTAGVDSGSVQVFLRGGLGWALEAVLPTSAALLTTDDLGAGVDISADGARILAGADSDDTGGGVGAGSLRAYSRSGTTWTEDALMVAFGGAAGDALGDAVAITEDGTRGIGGAPTDDAAFANGGTARVVTIGASVGMACSGNPACSNNQCVDGVCCNTTCGGGAADCQACSMALTGGADGTCAALSPVVAPTITCRASIGPCDITETCGAGSTLCPSDGVRTSAVTCRAAAGVCDVSEVCPGGSDPNCPVDNFLAGTTCRATSGLCDPAEACDGTAATCPAQSFAPSTAVCRPSSGVCDSQERCTGTTGACPVDTYFDGSTVCRTALSACDFAETCTGLALNCPPDVVRPTGASCRPSAGACDIGEVCDGTSGNCPGETLVGNGVVCRANIGSCDVAEACTGTSAACPGDAVLPAGTVCLPATGMCDVADVCTGAVGVCPATFAPATTECRAATGPCDASETCTGAAPGCPADAFLPVDTECAPSGGDVCDAPDTCTGSTANCPATFLSGVECRAAAGSCDVAEACAGSAATCPPDVILATGVSCRAATDPTCDDVESCDGVATSCPADVTSCIVVDAGVPDAGSSTSDAGPTPDAGRSDAGSTDASVVGADASEFPPAVVGACACRARAPRPLGLGGLVVLVFVGLAAARRRR